MGLTHKTEKFQLVPKENQKKVRTNLLAHPDKFLKVIDKWYSKLLIPPPTGRFLTCLPPACQKAVYAGRPAGRQVFN